MVFLLDLSSNIVTWWSNYNTKWQELLQLQPLFNAYNTKNRVGERYTQYNMHGREQLVK
jgi:hypothetical protein